MFIFRPPIALEILSHDSGFLPHGRIYDHGCHFASELNVKSYKDKKCEVIYEIEKYALNQSEKLSDDHA